MPQESEQARIVLGRYVDNCTGLVIFPTNKSPRISGPSHVCSSRRRFGLPETTAELVRTIRARPSRACPGGGSSMQDTRHLGVELIGKPSFDFGWFESDVFADAESSWTVSVASPAVDGLFGYLEPVTQFVDGA